MSPVLFEILNILFDRDREMAYRIAALESENGTENQDLIQQQTQLKGLLDRLKAEIPVVVPPIVTVPDLGVPS